MKPTLLITCLFALIINTAFGEPNDRTVTAQKPHRELARLHKEFTQRRTNALRSISIWYRAQLEALQQKHSVQPPEIQTEIANALAIARETYWQDDQPELRQVLLAASWLWRSAEDADGVATSFHSDGTVDHLGLHGTWRITGPCEITIRADEHEQFILRFNASLSAFEGDRKNVSGCRLPSAQ